MRHRKAKTKTMRGFVLSKYLYLIIFILGAATFSFPLVTNFLNHQTQTRVISQYEQEMAAMNEVEQQRLHDEAESYNQYVAGLEGNVTDELTDAEKATTDIVYMSTLATGRAIGYLEIPRIDVKLPIYKGASDEAQEKGVGHLERSSLPIGGESTHSVLTGHRGLPTARLLRDLGKMEIGDIFVVDSLDEKLAYEVEAVQTVLPHEVESLRIQDGRDLSTLITCDPYMINSHRLLVTGHRVDYSPDRVDEAGRHQISLFEKYIEYFALAAAFALIMLLVWIMRRRVRAREALAGAKAHTARGDEDA